MKISRLCFWFLLGCLLGAVPVAAFALDGPKYFKFSTLDLSPSSPYNGAYDTVDLAADAYNKAYGNVGIAALYCLNNCNDVTKSPIYLVKINNVFQTQVKIVSVWQGCPEGYTQQPGKYLCDPPNSCAPGVETNRKLTVGWSLTNDVNQSGREIRYVSFPDQICVEGCINNVSTVGDGSCFVAKNDGPPYRVTCMYTTVSTSSSCDLSYVDETANPQIPCPSGTLPGEVNGVRGCFKNGLTTETKTEETDTETGTKTTTTERTNPDGSKTTTTTITNSNGTSTTTITTTPPPMGSGDGSGDSPEEKARKDKIKDDLCKTDPDKCGSAKTLEKTSVEELYEKKTEKTVESVITDFKTRLADSAVGASVDDFFDITISGSCPVWSATIPYLDVSITIDHFCSADAAAMLQIAGAAVLIVFAYAAFKIAIL